MDLEKIFEQKNGEYEKKQAALEAEEKKAVSVIMDTAASHDQKKAAAETLYSFKKQAADATRELMAALRSYPESIDDMHTPMAEYLLEVEKKRYQDEAEAKEILESGEWERFAK